MTPRRLLLSPHAAIDLEEIAEYIARDNPVRGRKLRRRVGSEMPGGRRDAELYPARTDLAPGLRMAVHGRYVVLYRDLPGENARARRTRGARFPQPAEAGLIVEIDADWFWGPAPQSKGIWTSV